MATRLALLSSYSLLYSTLRPEQLFETLASWSIDRVAITDLDSLTGYPTYRQLAQEHGITLIAGAALTEGDEVIYAFVEDQAGWEELCSLLTARMADPSLSYLPLLRNTSLLLATSSPVLLHTLAEHSSRLYGAITPDDQRIVSTARTLGIPLLACDGSYLTGEDDRSTHRLLRAIATRMTVETVSIKDRGGILCTPRSWSEAFAPWPEAIANTEAITSYDPFPSQHIFPDYPVPDPAVELQNRVYRGAEARYGELNDAILSRLDYELEIITEKGFAPYFLVMHDIVQMSSRTCGRGSAAASAVSYCLFITDVDPLFHHLYFERFLSPSRTDPPDIDVDFAWDEREAIFRQIYQHFTVEHCARVANHLYFRTDSALRESAKAYGLSDGQISEVLHSLSRTVDDPLWITIAEEAERIVGLPRGLSMHSGGLVITPQPTTSYVPVTRSADGHPLLVWEKEGVELAGFVKIDLLGNRSLAVIRDAITSLAEEGIELDEKRWHPTDDQQTIEALSRGESMGVFYIESPAMRQLQKKTGRGDYDHIVIHSSLIRPAANRFITTYVRRLKGEQWESLHPQLDSILDETYGILCYQEDVSKVAVALAGFSEADADYLRKVIAKKTRGVRLRSYQEQFYAGCAQNGVSTETTDRIWEMMLSFDGYSFCKPHSASYAMVSFQSAYLRVHHAAHFMAAVLTNRGGYYEPGAYISEARRMGLSIEGPDINLSRVAYHGSGSALTIGLMAIASLSTDAMYAIVDERKRGGPYASLTEVVERLHLGREDVVALTQSGVFDSLAPTLHRSDQLRTLLTTATFPSAEEQLELFAPSPRPRPTALARRVAPTLGELEAEYATLGFLRSAHPLILYAPRIAAIPHQKASEIPRYCGRMITLIGHQITRKQVRTKGGELMSFISFEDETALYETVLFPHLYERYYPLLYRSLPLVVTGQVQDDHGALIIEVHHLAALPPCTKTQESAQLVGRRSRYERIPHTYR